MSNGVNELGHSSVTLAMPCSSLNMAAGAASSCVNFQAPWCSTGGMLFSWPQWHPKGGSIAQRYCICLYKTLPSLRTAGRVLSEPGASIVTHLQHWLLQKRKRWLCQY
jgi:hypothetical protein